MAAPNLTSPNSVTGKVRLYELTDSHAMALENEAASGKLFRISSIRASSLISTASIRVSVSLFREGTHRYLVKDAQISASKALVVSDRNEPINIEEGDALYASASSNSVGDLIVSYEEFS